MDAYLSKPILPKSLYEILDGIAAAPRANRAPMPAEATQD
jgi:hypothetical protein